MKDNEIEAVLRLALEALERIDLWLKARYSGIGLVGVELEALTALRQAIHATPLRAAAEQHKQAQKQEAVAWRNAALRVGEDLCSVGPFGYYDMTAEQWLDWALSVVTVHAPPPQRQPMTDEVAMFAAQHMFLEWNRKQDERLVKVAYEYGVFQKAIELYNEAAHGITSKD